MSRLFNPTWLLCIGVTCFGLAIAGCNKKENKDTSDKNKEAAMVSPIKDLIAVIDLNVVAQEIGAQAKIDYSLKQKEKELVSRFNGLKSELARKVDSLRKSEDLNDQKQNELDQLTAENQDKLSLQAQAAQAQLVGFHSKLKQKLLSDIRPVAYQIAKEKGMQIVLTVSQVYAAGPQVNITSDVVKRIKEINETVAARQPAKQPPERFAERPGGGEFTPR